MRSFGGFAPVAPTGTAWRVESEELRGITRRQDKWLLMCVSRKRNILIQNPAYDCQKPEMESVDSISGFFCLRCAGGDISKPMTSSLIWVLIGVYVGFFVFLQKVMKDS